MSQPKTVKIRITITTETVVTLAEDETVEEVKLRNADIYLHGCGEKGYLVKEDLGGDTTIEIIEE